MLSLYLLFALLYTHWVADFVFQNDWMAKNKSKSRLPLSVHVLVYSLFFIPVCLYFLPEENMIVALILIYCSHWLVDFFTSKITSSLSARGIYGSSSVPNLGMFSVIGFDQMLHYISLFAIFTALQVA